MNQTYLYLGKIIICISTSNIFSDDIPCPFYLIYYYLILSNFIIIIIFLNIEGMRKEVRGQK